MPIAMPTLKTLPKRESVAVARSQTERLWLIGGGLIAFVLLLIGYFFFVSPQRSDTANVDSQVASARQQNAQLKAKLDTLRAQNTNLAKYEADLAKARFALPATSGVSDFLRSLQALGGATHTDVTALTVSQPAAVKPAAPAATGAAAPGGVAPTMAAPTAAAGAPTTAVPTASVYSLMITATVAGTPATLNDFLNQLQAVQPRAVLITQISETATGSAANGGKPSAGTTLSLTMQAFVAPPLTASAAAPTVTH